MICGPEQNNFKIYRIGSWYWIWGNTSVRWKGWRRRYRCWRRPTQWSEYYLTNQKRLSYSLESQKSISKCITHATDIRFLKLFIVNIISYNTPERTNKNLCIQYLNLLLIIIERNINYSKLFKFLNYLLGWKSPPPTPFVYPL